MTRWGGPASNPHGQDETSSCEASGSNVSLDVIRRSSQDTHESHIPSYQHTEPEPEHGDLQEVDSKSLTPSSLSPTPSYSGKGFIYDAKNDLEKGSQFGALWRDWLCKDAAADLH